MLEAKNLMVFFENALALNDLDLEVHKGEIVAVLGSNSAGKTTLMNTASGLIIDMKKKETRRGGVRITIMGELTYEGEDILHVKPSERVRKGIVLSQERHPVFRESDVHENLKMAGYLRKGEEVKQHIALIFNLFPILKHLRKRKAGLLSGGEQQMLAIGRALMGRPKLLLLDEPTLGLAPLVVKEIMSIIETLRKEGTTILLVEQNARAALKIADRAYVLETGKVRIRGKASDLLENEAVRKAYLG